MPFSEEPPEYLVATKYILPNITMKMPPPLQPWNFPSLTVGLLDRYFSKHSSVPVLGLRQTVFRRPALICDGVSDCL